LEGVALRHQDMPVEGKRIHLSALALRFEHGTPAEQSESATSLGSCAQWTGDMVDAERWYRLASSLEATDTNEARQKSYAVIRLSTLLTQLGRHEEAVDAAKRAQNILSDHLPGDIATVCAGLHSAQATIGHAESRFTEDPHLARSLLDEVLPILLRTRENLQGFGPAANEALNWCDEQIDFATRLGQAIAPLG
jgi:hypothetical protein